MAHTKSGKRPITVENIMQFLTVIGRFAYARSTMRVSESQEQLRQLINDRK